MNLSSSAQATLLLTSQFAKKGEQAVKPLTNTEWTRFAFWLKERGRTPGDLLSSDPETLMADWSDPHVDIDRVTRLLERGHALGLAMEKWQRAGLWVVTRSDPDYPRLLKQRLRSACPPVLYGCGDKTLLNSGGLAVVGSRQVDDDDILFSQQVGAKAASEKVGIISGGARGVDEAAMLGAMNAGGVVVGVLADKLLAQAISTRWRGGLMGGNLALISPFYPEAGFNTGNAMARNKYIYCLSNAALVVRSGHKGGTINGARENLKHGWVPLWIRPASDENTANDWLVDKGGRWCRERPDQMAVQHLLAKGFRDGNSSDNGKEKPIADANGAVAGRQSSLFDDDATGQQSADTNSLNDVPERPAPRVGYCNQNGLEELDFYRIFVQKLNVLIQDQATPDELSTAANVSKSQIQKWLKQAEGEGLVTKRTRPVRYELSSME